MPKIITISREFGSGGRELGKRLSDELGFDYYDKEIITAIAEKKGLDETYVEKTLEFSAWRNMPLTYKHTFSSVPVVHSVETELLLEQTHVIEQIAKLDRDCVIVGRNADILLANENPFNIFVCANMQSKIKRCAERSDGEKISEKEIMKNIKRIDKGRKHSRAIISDTVWGERSCYHLIVNTSGWEIKELIPAVSEFAKSYFEKVK